MIRASVVSPWVTVQAERPRVHPRLYDDYTLDNFEQLDAASPPDPCLLRIVCAEDVFAMIQADPNYTVQSSETI